MQGRDGRGEVGGWTVSGEAMQGRDGRGEELGGLYSAGASGLAFIGHGLPLANLSGYLACLHLLSR